MKRLVVYRLGSIGDTVAALPCFHLISRTFPDYERIALTNVPVSSQAAPLEAVLMEGGFIHGTIPYPVGLRHPGELVRLARRLRRTGAATLIYLAASRGGWAHVERDVAYFRLCGFRHIYGAPRTRSLRTNQVGADGELERESHRLGRTLAGLGSIDLADRSSWSLRLTAREQLAAAAALRPLSGGRFVAVHAGSKAPEKDWGLERWTSALTTLGSAGSGLGLAVLGTTEDGDRASRLAASWQSGPTVSLCGVLSPRESAAALSRADLFIGHDSGPLHLADAVGTPAIGLFGDYNLPKKWHPSGPQTHILHRLDGLAAVAPEEVAARAIRILS